MTNLKQQILRYWLAMNASALDAAVHSCAAFFGVAGVHEALNAVPALDFKQLAAVFAISFVRGLLKYLDAHPVTDLVGSAPAGKGMQTATTTNEPAKSGTSSV